MLRCASLSGCCEGQPGVQLGPARTLRSKYPHIRYLLYVIHNLLSTPQVPDTEVLWTFRGTSLSLMLALDAMRMPQPRSRMENLNSKHMIHGQNSHMRLSIPATSTLYNPCITLRFYHTLSEYVELREELRPCKGRMLMPCPRLCYMINQFVLRIVDALGSLNPTAPSKDRACHKAILNLKSVETMSLHDMSTKKVIPTIRDFCWGSFDASLTKVLACASRPTQNNQRERNSGLLKQGCLTALLKISLLITHPY